MSYKKSLVLSIIGVSLLIVAVAGISYAFFGYVNTGTSNNIQTGTITFSASQDTINLSNAFPVSASTASAATSSTADVGIAKIRVSGNTTYANGIKFQVRVGTVTNTGTAVPTVSVTQATGLPTGITVTGTGNTLTNGAILANGTIAANKTATNLEVMSIKAYFDEANYFISENTASELSAVGITVPSGATIISPTNWNAKTYSFTIIVSATEGTA